MNDRSAMQHVRAQTGFAKVLSGIMQQLAASDDPADMLRAQCAPRCPAAWRAERRRISWPDRT